MTAGQWRPPERPDQPPSGPGPVSQTHRQPQPLQPAKALLILFLVRIGLLIVNEFGLEAVVWGLSTADVRDPLMYTLIGLGASGLALLSGGVWVACLVLAIVVIVKARDELRNGAIVLLVALVVPGFLAFDFSGDFGPPVVSAFYILGLVFNVLALIISAVGAVFLLRGYRAAAREEGSRYAMF